MLLTTSNARFLNAMVLVAYIQTGWHIRRFKIFVINLNLLKALIGCNEFRHYNNRRTCDGDYGYQMLMNASPCIQLLGMMVTLDLIMFLSGKGWIFNNSTAWFRYDFDGYMVHNRIPWNYDAISNDTKYRWGCDAMVLRNFWPQ